MLKVPKINCQRFWTWFIDNEKSFNELDFNNQAEMRGLFQKLESELRKVHDALTFEFGPLQEDGTRELVISADGRIEGFNAVKTLIQNAPSVTNWRWTAFRPRKGFEPVIEFGNGFKLSYDDLSVVVETVDEDNLVALSFFVQDYISQKRVYQTAIPILLDALLGEHDAVTYICSMDFYDKLQAHSDLPIVPFKELVTVIDNLKGA